MLRALPHRHKAASDTAVLALSAAIVAILVAVPPTFAQDGRDADTDRPGELAATVEAGIRDYEVTITVRNADQENLLRNIVVTPRDEPRYLTDLRVDPPRIAKIGPGASRNVDVRFDVLEEATDGAEETLVLDVQADGGFLDRPVLRVHLTIMTPEDEAEEDDTVAEADAGEGDVRPLPDKVFLLINIAGNGYVPHLGGGSYHVSGSHDEVFTVRRDEDPIAALQAYRERLIGDPCEYRVGRIGPARLPTFWSAGPQITVLDVGPFLTYEEARYHQKLKDTWEQLSRDGPLPSDLEKAAGCG